MKQFTFILFAFNCFFGQSQNTSVGINLQGELQFTPTSQSNIEIDVLLISSNSDTLYFESHANLNLYNDHTFNIIVGNGNYISGTNLIYANINWFDVQKIIVLQNYVGSYYNLGHYKISARPYALHSAYNLIPPTSNNLYDTPNSNFQNINSLFIFNGSSFIESNSILNDSILYAYYTDSTLYSDTADVAINNIFSDSSIFALSADSSNYSIFCTYSNYSDTTSFSDSSNISYFSTGNWSFFGNTNNLNSNFIGTTSINDLILKTNNTTRYRLTSQGGFTNTANNEGFSINSNGALFTMSVDSIIPYISTTHLFMSKKRSAIHLGSPLDNMDTLMGNYSFSFGDNTGTNGTYSTVFGKNTFGDSASIFGVNYESISSFALGNNCNATYVGVAIGYNCKAVYYRNVAIGKDVFSGQTSTFLPSASIGIGNNVISSGATSWAMGNNISATGHFSTVIGTNASSNFKLGSFVYGDFSTLDTVLSNLNNEFIVRAENGFVFYTSSDLSMGVTLNNGDGSWNMVSNQNLKENIYILNDSIIFQSMLSTPIYEWQYKNQDIIHIGPMAQTFNSNFKIGESNDYINSGDNDGVIFSGIKHLNQKIELKNNQDVINSTESKLVDEKNNLDELQLKIDLIYEKITD